MSKLPSIRSIVCLGLLAVAPPARAADGPAPLLIAADGRREPARLVSVDEGLTAEFEYEGRRQRLALAELVEWGAPLEPVTAPLVLLVDDGLLAAEITALEAATLALVSPLAGPVELPLESIRAVVLVPRSAPAGRDRLFDGLAGGPQREDLLLLENGDRLPGTLAALDPDRLAWEGAAGPLELSTSKVVAIRFDPTLAAAPQADGLRIAVGLDDGSRLFAQRLVVDQRQCRLELPGGLSLRVPTRSLVWLLPLGGRANYLSDRQPAGYRHVPLLSNPWPLAVDRGVGGGRLRSGGRLYLKGLGMHSASRVTYRLDKPYARFEAELALDDAAAPGGSVVFRVFVGDQPRYTSPLIRSGQAPLPMAVDLAGADSVSLVVEFAERGDLGDHANWLGARLIE